MFYKLLRFFRALSNLWYQMRRRLIGRDAHLVHVLLMGDIGLHCKKIISNFSKRVQIVHNKPYNFQCTSGA